MKAVACDYSDSDIRQILIFFRSWFTLTIWEIHYRLLPLSHQMARLLEVFQGALDAMSGTGFKDCKGFTGGTW